MYSQYFQLSRLPFTISPDPAIMFLSEGHQEALAHLQYSLSGHGGLICLTGEVGTGKTTLCRLFLEQAGDKVKTAYIYNPCLTAREMLGVLCDELDVSYPDSASEGDLYRYLQAALLKYYSAGYQVLCVIDEAQAMPASQLEMVRLLTNLETATNKLMTLILVGQPELRELLQRHDLRQLNQRITARYHLQQLKKRELKEYLTYRLSQAGCDRMLFTSGAINALWRLSQGIPRQINIIADRALLGAYAKEKSAVNAALVKQAAAEVAGQQRGFPRGLIALLGAGVVIVVALLAFRFYPGIVMPAPVPVNPVSLAASAIGLNTASCERLSEQSDYSCLWTDLPVRDIRRLGLPYALSVRTAAGEERWDTELLDGDQYTGKALLLWKGPAEYQGEVIRPGVMSPYVAWARGQLGMPATEWSVIGSANRTSESVNEFYDPLMADHVADFQRRNGLSADRILGPKTLLYLSLVN